MKETPKQPAHVKELKVSVKRLLLNGSDAPSDRAILWCASSLFPFFEPSEEERAASECLQCAQDKFSSVDPPMVSERSMAEAAKRTAEMMQMLEHRLMRHREEMPPFQFPVVPLLQYQQPAMDGAATKSRIDALKKAFAECDACAQKPLKKRASAVVTNYVQSCLAQT